MTYAPKHIPVSTRAEAIAKGAKFWGVGFERNKQATANLEKQREGETVLLADPEQTPLRSMAKQALAMPSTLALWQASKAKPQLSKDGALAACKERLMEVIDGVRRDYL